MAPGWEFNIPRGSYAGPGDGRNEKYSITLEDGKSIPVIEEATYGSETRTYVVDTQKHKTNDFTFLPPALTYGAFILRYKDGTSYEFGKYTDMQTGAKRNCMLL